MSADSDEEGVLLSEFGKIFDAPSLLPAVDDLVAMDVVADLAEISQPLPHSPITSLEIEQLFTISSILKSHEINFESIGARIWSRSIDRRNYQVTFNPATAEAQGIRLMSYCEPLFDRLLSISAV